jgi:hypothetical protein
MGYSPQIGDLVANNIDYNSVMLGMITNIYDLDNYVIEWYDKSLNSHIGYYGYNSLRHMRELFLSVKKEKS